MPTNLPPDYYEVEREYRAATSNADKIALLEEMYSLIPKHKGTDHLRADLRRRLSKLKEQSTSGKGGARQDAAFHIDKEGAGQVVVVGTPNVGKSSLVAALTNARPEVAPYPYTTWVPTPGMMTVGGVQVQLVDTPPLNREHVEPLLMDLIRRSDLILLMLDLQGHPLQELEDAVAIMEEHRIFASHRPITYEGQRRVVSKPVLVLANKNDDEATDDDSAVLEELLQEEGWPVCAISATTGRGLERMAQEIFSRLGIMRIYCKPPGEEPDLGAPFVLPEGGTVADLAAKIHKDFVEQLKAARVWGAGVFDGQMVSRDHVLHDGDIVELRA